MIGISGFCFIHSLEASDTIFSFILSLSEKSSHTSAVSLASAVRFQMGDAQVAV